MDTLFSHQNVFLAMSGNKMYRNNDLIIEKKTLKH